MGPQAAAMSRAPSSLGWASWPRAVDAFANTLVAAALLTELALVVAEVFARHFVGTSFLWADEVARFALSVLTFVGGAVAYRRRHHAYVSLLIDRAPDRVRRACLALADVIVIVVAVLTIVHSVAYLAAGWTETTPILRLPACVIGFPLPIGMALLAFYAGLNIVRDHRMSAVPAALFLVTLAAVGSLTQDWWLDALGDHAGIIVALTLFVVAILAAVPVGFVLILSTMTYLWATDAAPMAVVAQTMVNGTGNFILLAVPFFILAGLVMERGGISVRLVNFIRALVGHVRGGLLQVTVGSMYVISGLSGSKPADVAAVGTVMRDELRERHGAPEGAAVLAASAIMGETIPPSIAMLIVGSITNVSMAALFIGGFIPALVMALCLGGMIYWRAVRAGVPRMLRPSWPTVRDGAMGAALPLLMPAMLLGGILGGIATPTEVAALAVLYGLGLATLVYGALDRASLVDVILDTAVLTGVLLFIFAAASTFSWSLTVAYLPQTLVAVLAGLGNSQAIFMILSIVLLIVVGVLLEGLPSLNVLAPLLLPIAVKLGIGEVHYALVLIIAMGVGGFMPLAGVGFYVCCAVMRCDVESASRAMLPYLAVVLVGLLIIAFVPWFSTALPHYFGFRG